MGWPDRDWSKDRSCLIFVELKFALSWLNLQCLQPRSMTASVLGNKRCRKRQERSRHLVREEENRTQSQALHEVGCTRPALPASLVELANTVNDFFRQGELSIRQEPHYAFVDIFNPINNMDPAIQVKVPTDGGGKAWVPPAQKGDDGPRAVIWRASSDELRRAVF